ncbi:MAG: TetR/AcrR family transcriptional regulator [Chromatiales bacterium]|jgi:TetR/AcrR family transcriptional repressor of nem operon|nr:TetR/AcrR family transcriptional regulator [Chromatiales bacterium]MDX9768689.1 TetR/AcrR family transcriptional regulator [Ectothiorhodospiraceae bacterium]
MPIDQPIRRRRGRPPKDASDRDDTREALLRAGLEVLTEKGFSATGIDEILRRVSVPKGSFYHYFASKEAFGIELIDRYAAYFAHKLDCILNDASRPPLQRLRAFVADAADSMARHNFRRGCLIGNLGQEMGSLPEHFRARLADVFADWQVRVERCLLAARDAGALSPTADCPQLAAVFWIGWEGAVLRARLERRAEPLVAFGEFFLDAIEQ